MRRFAQFLTLFMVAVLSAHAVPAVLNYAGQVAVNGQPFDGEGLFKFALVNADGNATCWSNDGTSTNGSEPAAHVSISVNGGLYSLLLGNTAISGMGAIDPQVFAQHGDAKLRVWFSDGVNGFQQLSPDRPFASVPYAFSAGSATIANGSINKSMLGSDVIADLNKTVTITRDMLPQDVRDDLNRTVTITRDMLPADVLSDLNRTISKPMLGSDVIADLNATIGMDRLSSEVTAKLDQNGSGTSGIAVGSIISFPSGQAAPDGYSLYQQGTPKELVWEEKAPVSVARTSYDGAEVLHGKIYFVGGHNGSTVNLTEQYDPVLNSWEALSSISVSLNNFASSVLNGQIWLMGGWENGTNSSDITLIDPVTNSSSSGGQLPFSIRGSTAISVDDKIFLIGGYTNQSANTVLCFDSATNSWSVKASMPTPRWGTELVLFDNKIWVIGGMTEEGLISHTKIESYDYIANYWQAEPSLLNARNCPMAWVANGNIYVAGGHNGSEFQQTVEMYDPATKQWFVKGNLPENKFAGDAVVLNNNIYIIGGESSAGVLSNKVYAADLNASMAGVYDLYRKDGNASAGTPLVQAEVADGSVTTAKIASNTITTSDLSEQILKYLKPEITSQPIGKVVYEDSNVSFSVTAAGKYLTYQWKKDGSNLTGETSATLTITDANATLHDGNYSVVVRNDFGSVETGVVEVLVSNYTLMNGLVAWWKFDETNGTIAYDSSGNGNDGNLTNGPTWATGKIGGALSFDGVDDFVQINGTWPGENSPRAISVWFHTNNVDSGNIFTFGDGTRTNTRFSVRTNYGGNGNLYFVGQGNDASLGSMTFNKWLHLYITYSLNFITALVDNGLIANVSKILNTDGSMPLIIGSNSLTRNNEFFTGKLDDVRIYDRALSAAEVQALYDLGQ